MSLASGVLPRRVNEMNSRSLKGDVSFVEGERSEEQLPVLFDENAIDSIFSPVDQCHLGGAAVGIAIGGTPIYRKGFGLASMELPVVLSPSIRMRIGSVTKHFTSLAYMLLCEDGRAGIDDPIRKFLPHLNPVCHDISMRQLMSHVSGLRDSCDIRLRLSGYGGTPT